MKSVTLAAVSAAAMIGLGAVPAAAVSKTQTGNVNGLKWQAQSYIVGQTSTGGNDGGGDAIYYPTQPQKRGVVALIMDYGPGGRFICSGSLASDRRSIITAGHCVSGGAGTDNPLVTTAYFWDGGADDRVPFNPAAVAIDVSQYFVNPGYTGAVIDHNDIAVLRLAELAPDFATAYDIYTGGDLTGDQFNVAGYGRRSDVGGAVGANQRTGFLREGDNIYDFRLGDDVFGGQWEDIFADQGPLEYSFVSDFDNGLAANDTACIVSSLGLGLPAGSFCDTGLGAREVGIAGGDSGGPGFINGQLASVNSYGLTFGSEYGDFDNALNSSWGEFSGYVPLYIHEQFIRESLVPEPATWAMMIIGFGAVGSALRRQRRTGYATA